MTEPFCHVGGRRARQPSPVGCASVDRRRRFANAPKLADQSELVLTAFAPAEMEALVTRSGLTIAAHPTADELAVRYCSARDDGLRPFALERLIACRRD